MKIAILLEGATERAFKKKLCEFLQSHLGQKMPRLHFITQDGPIPKERKLKKLDETLLDNNGYHAVIALTDVYTGKPDLKDPTDAKKKMMTGVKNTQTFSPHTHLHILKA